MAEPTEPDTAGGPDDHRSSGAARGRVRRRVVRVLLAALAFWLDVTGLLVLVSHWAHLGPVLGGWRWPAAALLLCGLTAAWAAMGRISTQPLDDPRGDRLGGAVRGVLYAVVLAWALVLVAVQPVDGAAVVVVLALAAAAWAAVAAAQYRLGHGRLARVVRAADFVLLNLCVVAVAGELGLRAVAELRPSVLLMRSSSGVVENIERARYAPGTVRHGCPVNSGGHYDDEFVPKREGRRLVLAIGDSFSAGVVHHSLHFTTVAERALPGVDIYNMGVPAIGPPEYHHLLVTEGLSLHPDVVVINLFVGNDLTYPLPPAEEHSVMASWLDRDNVLLALVPVRLVRLAREGRRVGDQLEGRDDGGSEPVLRTPEAVRKAFPWVDNPSLERPKLAKRTFLQVERSRYERLRSQSHPEYERRLEPLRAIREAAGKTPVMVMLIPDIFQVEDGLWQQVKGPSFPATVGPPGPGRPQATLRDRMRGLWFAKEWLRREEIPYLDLLPILREVPAMDDGDRHLYHKRDTHFNARGNRVVGEALAAFLRDHQH